jgi:hypothetical protein
MDGAVRVQARAPARPAPSFTPVRAGLLQRCSDGTCGCDKKRADELQRMPASGQETGHAPAIVQDVLASSGRPLDQSARPSLEAAFGHDFGSVRVHTDERAAESARTVRALAYTVGRHIVFADGHYAPGTTAGRTLLAHELAHVVQQSAARWRAPEIAIAPDGDRAEREAEASAARVSADGSPGAIGSRLSELAVTRKVRVEAPATKIPKPGGKGLDQTNAATIQAYCATLCPSGAPTVDGTTGELSMRGGHCTPPPVPGGIGPPAPSPAGTSATPTGCECLCDMIASAHTWRIQIDDGGWPGTAFDDDDAASGKTPGGTGGIVTAPSPNSPKLWGAATTGGRQLDIDPWLVLGHELCGHGWLGNFGRHAPDEAAKRGEGGHQETVQRENLLRKEHGIDLRGTFKDPNCGESYWRNRASPRRVNWSSYRAVCEQWRRDYNRRRGTSYKITDRIP